MSELSRFHVLVHACDRCFGADGCGVRPDPQRVDRALPPGLRHSDVMLVGEAIGPGTQRLSGWPYLEPGGRMRVTGKNLDGLLAQFGYTIRPDSEGKYAYSTDLVRCLPFDADGKWRHPHPQEIANCLPWLETEIELVRPRVVVLLGTHAVRAFFERYLGRSVERLRDVVGGPYRTRVGDVDLQAFVVPHPSGAGPAKPRQRAYDAVGPAIAAALART